MHCYLLALFLHKTILPNQKFLFFPTPTFGLGL